MAGFGLLWRVLGMPEYEYEALNASGELVTGTSLHSNEAFARAKLEKLGLHPVKLSVREETPRDPVNKFWDGTFFDTVMWLLVLCIPIAGLFSPTPDVGFLSGVVVVFFLGAARVFTGNWHSGNH